MDNTILVLGATGQQGGAVARQLLANGFKVKAFTREAESDAVRNLNQLGAEIFQGDMGSEADLSEAMKAVYGVFSVQPASWAPTPKSDELEAQLGILVADVAKKSGVQHFIYSSVFVSELQASFRPKFKYTIEEHIWKLGFRLRFLNLLYLWKTLICPISGFRTQKFITLHLLMWQHHTYRLKILAYLFGLPFKSLRILWAKQ